MRKIAHHALIICCAALLATTVNAATEVESAGAVRIEMVAQPREVELPTQFFLAFRLVNTTDDSVVFRSFKLTPLEEPGGLKISDGCAKTNQVSVPRNSAVAITCHVHSKDFNDGIFDLVPSLLASWSLLTFQPGEYRFVATAEVRIGDVGVMAVSQTVPVKIRPTVWQICVGASLGALLLVIFTFSSARARNALMARERVKVMKAYRLWIVEPFLLWLGATVSASIFIFMTYRLKDVSSPLTITVNDFYGGVVIGLFGVLIADKLAEKFFSPQTPGQPTATSNAGATAGQAPAPVTSGVNGANAMQGAPDEHLDGCDVPITQVTADEDLPAARGGVA